MLDKVGRIDQEEVRSYTLDSVGLGCTLTAVTSVFKFSTHCALSHNARGRHWISLQVDATPCLMQHTSHIALEV